VYGEATVIPTPEDDPPMPQTSLYAASKLAGEALIEAYCEGFGMQAWIFRFVSILGERYTHGHVFDFYKQLVEHSDKLHILGDGSQRKSYLYIQDCIDAIFTALEKAGAKVNKFNLGTDEFCQVNDSIGWICQELGISPAITCAGGKRGWVGDNPFIFLDCSRMRALGWRPKLTIKEGIVRTLRYLRANPWVMEAR
jgi:UDP-glucose 4-epimerase